MRSAILFMIICITALACGAARAKVTDEQVRSAIRRMVDRLYALQNERGTWDPQQPNESDGRDIVFGINYGGTTALATYALLVAGESYQSPKLKNAIEFLGSAKSKIAGTYAVSFRNHVWAQLPPSFKKRVNRDTRWLIGAMGGGPAGGGYTYHSLSGQTSRSVFDNSNTQYGVLGVWEGAKRGIRVPPGYWEIVGKHFVESQDADGGWGYSPHYKPESYGSMTAAGLACLYIVRDQRYRVDYRKPGAAARHPLQQRIDKAVAWFDEHFNGGANPPATFGVDPYYLVGVERVALAGGYKHFAGRDWYAEGAEALINAPVRQAKDLAFAIIFLVRGRVPVFINKLRIADFDWNNRPSDLANLVDWVSEEVEQEMNWQVIDLDAGAEDWLDAPILYIAGHRKLELESEHEEKLKRFIDLGGMIVTTADEGAAAFTLSIRKMYERLFPDYQLKRLANDDLLLDIVFPLKGNRTNALSLHNGVRHLALHLPGDISWRLHSNIRRDETLLKFFTNLYYYATEKGNARPRLDNHFVSKSFRLSGQSLQVARVVYEGNWNPEPLAWEVQANHLHNAGKANVSVRDFGIEDLAGSSQRFAHVVGTTEVEFTEQQLEEFKRFVANGGTILFENAGGNGAFANSVIATWAKAYPDHPVRPVRPGHPLITGRGFGGDDTTEAEYRPFTLLRIGRIKGPRIQAINFDAEPRIIISGEDLSMAMLNQPRWGVYGYKTPDAQRIMSNILLWAHRNK